jgi:phage terminase large subunit GpA-like protein
MDPRAGYDREYFKGLISEKMEIHRKNGQAKIVWNQFYDRNEPLDCRNYARAAYRYFHWHFDEIEKAIRGEHDEPIVETKAARKARQNRHVISAGIKV